MSFTKERINDNKRKNRSVVLIIALMFFSCVLIFANVLFSDAKVTSSATALPTANAVQLVQSVKITNVKYEQLTIYVNESYSLRTSVSPVSATNREIVWTSGDTNVVEVDNSGVLKGKKAGTTTVRATAKDESGVYAEITVTVGQPVETLTGEKASVTVVSGETTSLGLKAFPENASNQQLYYESGNKSIFTVDANGVITGKLKGKATLRVFSADGRYSAYIQVVVKYPSFTYTLKKKEKKNITKIIGSAYSIRPKKVTSGNKKIATVSKNGVVKAVKNGKVTISAKRLGSVGYVEVALTVGKPVKNIVVNNQLLAVHVGRELKLNTKIKPAAASNKVVHYSVADSSIATISESGIVKGIKEGTTNIKIASDDGRKKINVSVTVGAEGAELLRKTTDGSIMGQETNYNVVSWLGVPYAQAPVGDLRWRAPQDNIKWSGVRKANTAKSLAKQIDGGQVVGSEDCLYLNIYRPNTKETNLPIIVYLHGGSNLNGSKTSFTGKVLSAFGVTNAIVISVDYRLNAFGWLNLPALKTGNPEEDSGNFALLDVKKALEWVQANAEVFGGNKNNVTLSGFSAGARNVLATMISPIFDGLYNKAFVMSGGVATAAPEDGQASANKKLAKFVVAKGFAADENKAIEWLENTDSATVKDFLYSLTEDEVVQIFTSMNARFSNFPHLYTDGYVLPKEGFVAFKTGNYRKVPIMIGSDANEFASFSLASTRLSGRLYTDALLKNERLSYLGNASNYYGSQLFTCYNLENTVQNLWLHKDQPTIFAYRMKWGMDPIVTGSSYYTNLVGACHGMTRKFLLGNFESEYEAFAPYLYADYNAKGREVLASNMRMYLKNFLWNGNPNGAGLREWTGWNGNADTNRVMIFDASKTEDRSGMSAEYYDKQSILDRVEKYVSPEIKGMLLDSKAPDGYIGTFYNRVFMVDYLSEVKEEQTETGFDDSGGAIDSEGDDV